MSEKFDSDAGSGRIVRRLRGMSLFALPLAVLAGAGCLPSGPVSIQPPSAIELLEPDPGYSFAADSGSVAVQNLSIGDAGVVGSVCYSSDGSDPSGCDNILTGGIDLDCGSDTSATTVRTIKLAFSWDDGLGNQTSVQRSGNYFLDCTPPPVDTDGDGIPDSVDNCPAIPNPGQEDENGIDDGIGQGDACEDEPIADADLDTKEDAFDNCELVWNYDQADNDNDGIGNVCDDTPEGPPVAPLANPDLMTHLYDWMTEIRCAIRCSDPTGGGRVGSYNCANGGTAVWDLELDIFGGEANSIFTYTNCEYTNNAGVTLIVDGQLTQYSDFNANGHEVGDVTVGGDYSGEVTSHNQFNNRVPNSQSYYSVGCTADPDPVKECVANGVKIDLYALDWHCLSTDPLCVEGSDELLDSDGDGVFDNYDNCPGISNPGQTNADFDAEGDACDSTNNAEDADGDLVPDNVDNCPNTSNPNQADADGDGEGDACDSIYDPDSDGDGYADNIDNCPMDANPGQGDADGDGDGDACDLTPNGPDTDNDGVPDGVDNCPNDTNNSQADQDNDGIGDACDADPGYVMIFTRLNSGTHSNDADPNTDFPGRCVRSYDPSDSSEDDPVWDAKRWFGSDVFNSPHTDSKCDRDIARWTILAANTPGYVLFQNVALGTCMKGIDNAAGFKNVSLASCDPAAASQQWLIDRYDEINGVTFDLKYPSRLYNLAEAFCIYGEDYGNGNIFGADNNCNLGLGEGNRQFGIYFGGDFDTEPYE